MPPRSPEGNAVRSVHRSRTDSIRLRERQRNVARRIVELYERRYRLVDAEEDSESAMTREEALFQMWLDENLFDR